MDRRSFLTKAGLAAGGATAAAAFPKPAIAQDMRELKMVTTWPKNFPGLGTGAQRVADRITAMSDGRMTVQLFAAGELVPPFESFDAVSTGTAELYHGADYYWQGKNKGFNFFTTVPLGMTAAELNGWIDHAGGQELWDELAAEFNVKPFLAGNTGVQMGGWFRKEMNSLEDFKGLNFRMPGLGGEVLRELGANVQALPGGEIFPALQSGAIDGTEWVGPWNDLAFGFYQVADYYYWPGFHEPGAGLSCGVNKELYDGLSAEDQAIIENACMAENSYMYSEFMANNGAALATLVNEHGVNLREFTPEIFDQIAVVSEEVVNAAAEDDIGQRILASYRQARDDIGDWTRISDQAYVNARQGALGTR